MAYSPGYTTSEPDLEAISRSGARYERLSFSCGDKNWSEYNAEVELATEHGITVLGNIYGNCSGTGGGKPYPKYNAAAPSAEWRTFETFVWEIVQHYGIGGSFWAGRSPAIPISIWEVWNEPNLGVNNPGGIASQPEEYGKFLKRTAGALHEAQGSSPITVLMGGLISVATGSSEVEGVIRSNLNVNQFLQGVAAVTGAEATAAGIGIHPYAFGAGSAGAVESNIAADREWITHDLPSGGAKSMWITEIGWPVEPDAPVDSAHERVSPAEQANLLATVAGWVEANQAPTAMNIQSFLYYFYRDMEGGTQWDAFTGLRRQPVHGFTEANFRPAWYVYQQLTHATRWPVPSTIENLNPTGLEPYGAELHATFNPHGLPTHGTLEWGTSTAYSHSMQVFNNWREGASPASEALTGLTPGRTYHYRWSAVNENAETTSTADETFTAPETPNSGWAARDASSGQQWAYYVGSDGRICLDAFQTNYGWSFACPEGGQPGAAGTAPAVDRNSETGTQSIFYAGTNGRICRLGFSTTAGWSHYCESSGAAIAAGSSPVTLEDVNSGEQWADYVSSGGRLCVSSISEPGSWLNQCPTQGPNAALGTTPAAMRDASSREQWVYYVSSTNRLCVDAFSYQSGWQNQCPSAGPAVEAGTSPSVMRDPISGEQWAYYTSSSGRVCLYAFNTKTGWANSCPAAGEAAAPGSSPAVTRNASGLQHIYYVGSNGRLCLYAFNTTSGWTPACPEGTKTPAPGRALAITQDFSQGDLWTYYVGANSRLCLLAFDTRSGFSSACPEGVKPVASASSPASSITPAGEEEVIYNSSLNVCRLPVDPSGVANNPDCAEVGQAPALDSSPSAVVGATSGEVWAYYIGANRRLCVDAQVPGAGWNNQCLATGPAAAANSSPASIRDAASGEQWTYYVSEAQRICVDAFNIKSGFSEYCPTVGAELAAGTSPAVMRSAASGEQWIYYQTANHRICLDAFNTSSGWAYGCPPTGEAAAPATSPAVVRDAGSGEQWIYYIDSGYRLCVYSFNTTSGWSPYCPTVGPAVAPGSSPAVMRNPETRELSAYYVSSTSRICVDGFNYVAGWANQCPTVASPVAPNTSPTVTQTSSGEQRIHYVSQGYRLCELKFDQRLGWRNNCPESGQPVG
ncbi:MAG TPA: hypothetical protein VH299_14665 [Solirubrobacterales bacterium]|jgi:hypothetical protein|nr:hypothetical protein [Solirubrobacterales bacterium]